LNSGKFRRIVANSGNFWGKSGKFGKFGNIQ
jgi:hypothetical protein